MWPVLLQPVEDRVAMPAAALEHDFEPVRQHARNVVGEAAAGDVRQAMHRHCARSARSSDFT